MSDQPPTQPPRERAGAPTTARKAAPNNETAGAFSMPDGPQSASTPAEKTFDFLAPDGGGALGRLGPYRVLRVVGRGGMGIVFVAEDTVLHRQVALKVMRPAHAQKPAARERFLREARATALIEHDHIVTIYQVGEDGGVPFLAMQLLKGSSLESWLCQGNRPTLRQALRMGRETALGLAAAHARGLVHRDIKPANLWLENRSADPNANETRTGVGSDNAARSMTPVRIKILDFGLARATTDNTNITRQGQILGTPLYMSPEQARGRELDARSDIFSLGCVLYRLLTGVLPFKGEETMAVLLALINDTPRPVRDLNPEVPPALAELVERMLAKEPAERPDSARLVADTLQAIEREVAGRSRTGSGIVAGLPAAVLPASSMPATASPPRTARPARPVSQRAKRWPLVVGAGAVLGAALLVSLSCCLFAFWPSPGTPDAPAVPTGPATPVPPAPTAPVAKAERPPSARSPFTAVQAKKFQDDGAVYLQCDVEATAPLGAKFVLVPPGEFEMGSTEVGYQNHVLEWKKHFKMPLPEKVERRPAAEGPAHLARITRPFLLARCEVTVGQFRAFVADTKYRTEAEESGKGGTGLEPEKKGPFLQGEKEVRRPEYTWNRPGLKITEQHPVSNITWRDADAFCRWLSAKENKTYRLPTEAEWEYACRAGTTTSWFTGDAAPAKNSSGMWTQQNARNTTHAVGQSPANAFGLFDMHGNVAELCADYFDPDYYAAAPVDDPAGPAEGSKGRVVRGGSFHLSATSSRSAARSNTQTLGAPSVQIGFRIVCELPPPPK
jgi:eukaryotic-like serine/threonine-protein kinase